MTKRRRNWAKIGVISAGAIGIITLVSMWAIHFFSIYQVKAPTTAKDRVQNSSNITSSIVTQQSIGNIRVGNNSMVNISIIAGEQKKSLEDVVKKQYAYPFPDRPKVVIVQPSVTFTNYIDNPPNYTGLVRGTIVIPLLNIGGISAKNVKTKWIIVDNGRPITSAEDYFKSDPFFIPELKPETAISLQYGPELTAAGTGSMEITLTYEYFHPITNERYTGEFKGIVDYRTEKNSVPKTLLLTPQ